MKANEWKHWTLVCSMFSLQGIMSQHDLNIWCLFVNDCHILCRQVITLNETEEAHTLLNIFCDQLQQKYGTENCVTNMNMAFHLKDCIKDYDSVYGFWCFTFERFHGILGKFHTNKNGVSLQVMRELVSGSQLRCGKIVKESVFREIKSTTQACHDMYVLRQAEVLNGSKIEFSCEKRLSLVREAVLTRDVVCGVEDLFKQLYGWSFVCVSSIVKKMTRIEFLGETLAINNYRSSNSPYNFVMAKLRNVNGVARIEEGAGIIIALHEVSVQRMRDE